MRYKEIIKNTLLIVTYLIIINQDLKANNNEEDKRLHYVNMGSSFAAGSGILPPNTNSVKRCMQSKANLASLLAKKLNFRLEDRSCGGAKSIHLLKPWKELPAQIDAINKDTKLVTITVGGNDLNYVTNLFALSCDKEKGMTFNGKKFPCFKESIVEEKAYVELEDNLNSIVKKISTVAPQAKVIFIQYVTLVPKRLCEAISLTKKEANRMRLIGERLAFITSSVAKKSTAMLLDADTLSIDHTPCDKKPWSIGTTVTTDNSEGIHWHPNRRANEMIAYELEKMFQRLYLAKSTWKI